jgi:hypothetical protein
MSVQVINTSPTHAGFPKLAALKKIGLILLVFILAAAGYAYYLFQKPHSSIADKSPQFKLSATTLVSEYSKDEKAANEKYLGKIIEVDGTISEKVKDEKGKYNITLQAEDLSGVGCEFEPGSQEQIKNLHEGDKVRIKGICTGVLMDVVLVDCIYIKE